MPPDSRSCDLHPVLSLIFYLGCLPFVLNELEGRKTGKIHRETNLLSQNTLNVELKDGGEGRSGGHGLGDLDRVIDAFNKHILGAQNGKSRITQPRRAFPTTFDSRTCSGHILTRWIVVVTNPFVSLPFKMR